MEKSTSLQLAKQYPVELSKNKRNAYARYQKYKMLLALYGKSIGVQQIGHRCFFALVLVTL